VKKEQFSIFEEVNYKEALKKLIDNYTGEKRGLQTRLAEAIGCQQAYISRVLSDKAEFNQEQALAISHFFDLDQLEKKYFFLLVNYNRAGTDELKKYYKLQIEEIISQKMTLSSRINKGVTINDQIRSVYYSDWIYVAVHMLTSISEYQTVHAITSKLNCSQERLLKVLEFLIESGLVKKEKNAYKHISGNLHLENDSPFIKNHHSNWRLKAIEDVGHGDSKSLHYSSVVSCSEKDFQKIQDLMISTIKKIREIVKDSKDEKIFCYSLDGFPVFQ
jgi:uncharacterized protein (TIGR02147 family)